MTIEEKIAMVSQIKKEIRAKNKLLKTAIAEGNIDNQEELNTEIRLLNSDIAVLNSDFKEDRKLLPLNEKIDEDLIDFKNKVTKLKNKIELHKGKISDIKSSELVKEKEKISLVKAEENLAKLKGLIYKGALENSGIDYTKDQRYPEQAISKQEEKVNKLKEEIEQEKKSLDGYNKRRTAEQEGYDANYKQRLDENKMTQIEYDLATKGSNSRYESDINKMSKPLMKLEEELKNIEKQRDDIKAKSDIYNKYADMYKSEFGEELISFSGNRDKAIEDSSNKEKDGSKETTNKKENIIKTKKVLKEVNTMAISTEDLKKMTTKEKIVRVEKIKIEQKAKRKEFQKASEAGDKDKENKLDKEMQDLTSDFNILSEAISLESKNIKAPVNRRISELEGFVQVLNGVSSNSRKLREEYEKEKARSEQDYDSIGLVNPDAEKLESLKDECVIAEDRVKVTKENVAKALEAIKKDALGLSENSKGIKEEKEKLKTLENDKKNAELKIASKERRLNSLAGAEKNSLQAEIDEDKANLLDYDEKISKQKANVQNIQDAIDSYEAYKVAYNKYSVDKLPEIDDSIVVDESERIDTENTEKPNQEEPNTVKPIKVNPIETIEEYNKLYKELKNGSIKPEDKLKLYATVKDESKYNSFGITTGAVFSESKKILKEEISDLQEQMGSFVKKNQVFAPNIKFETFYKNEKFFKNDRGFGDKVDIAAGTRYHVEAYIEEMEKHIAGGSKLTSEQEKTYKQGLELQSKIDELRAGLKAHYRVKSKRKEKSKESFKEKLSKFFFEDKKALPEAKQKEENSDKTEEKIDENTKFKNSLDDLVNRKEISPETARGFDEMSKEQNNINKGSEDKVM